MDNTLRKAAEMALEALEYHQEQTRPIHKTQETISALRQALAQWDTSDMAHRTGGLGMEQENEACGYAKRLAQAIWEKYYKEESPDWKPKNDVLGLLTQIDNMTCGLEKAQPEQEPVAWINKNKITWIQKYGDEADVLAGVSKHQESEFDVPLYTAPPSKQEPVREHDKVDLRCECCGYMTYHREHLGCIRAAAPPSKPWVSLTDEDKGELYNLKYADYLSDYIGIVDFILIAGVVEAALKEKNNG